MSNKTSAKMKNFLLVLFAVSLAGCDRETEELYDKSISAEINGGKWIGDADRSSFKISQTDEYESLGSNIMKVEFSLVSDDYLIWLEGPLLVQDSIPIVEGIRYPHEWFAGTLYYWSETGDGALPTKVGGYITGLQFTNGELSGNFSFDAGFSGEQINILVENGQFKLTE